MCWNATGPVASICTIRSESSRATVRTCRPSIWMVALLALPLLRAPLQRLMSACGHGELLVIFGVVVTAGGAGLLLAVNVVCVILSAKLVFLAKGVKPRTWYERRKARQSTLLSGMVWVVFLLILLAIIYVRRGVLI